MQDHVSTLRTFNRSFTQRIGVLDDSFLGSGRALGPSRLLYEIGRDGIGVFELRARLGLDSGYVSRLLRQLESERLVTVSPDPDDGRRRTARLTSSGLEEWESLDRRSDELAERLVAPLTPRRARRAQHSARRRRTTPASSDRHVRHLSIPDPNRRCGR